MDDLLAKLSPEELAGWYGRLADRTAENKWGGTEHLASRCLRLWLENRKPYTSITIDAPVNIRNSPYVVQALKYHRRVYLTEEKARLGDTRKWAGIVPRLSGSGRPKVARLRGINMDYESLVEIPITSKVFALMEDKDLLYAMHGLQLKTEVTVSCLKIAGSEQFQVVFVNFEARMKNRYEWNPDRYITVTNPDFKSRARNAVAPESRTVSVFNKHAQRLEEAGLAAPYYLESEVWYVDKALCTPAQVDPTKEL